MQEIIFLSLREWLKKELKLKIQGDNITMVLDNANIKKFINSKRGVKNYKIYDEDPLIFWDKYKNSYSVSFEFIQQLSQLIDVVDNNPEPIKKFRSHLHDVSHLIYSLHADIFISDDKRLRNKFTEVCRFLNNSTELLSRDEFFEKLK